MRTIKRIKTLFWISASCFFINSVTVLFMPIASETAQKTNGISNIISGVVFWLFLIAGYAVLFSANKERKTFAAGHFQKDNVRNEKMGTIKFFSNIQATIADSVLIASIIASIIVQFTALKNHYIVYVLRFLILLSLNLHGMFNGRVYKITKYKSMRREEGNE